jgi:hypothetical protein
MSVKKRHRAWGKLPIEIVQDIINLYKLENSTRKISELLNVPYTTVSNTLKKHNITLRPPTRRYTLNENYFDLIDSSDKAYFLGLLYADGNVSNTQDGYRVKIGLQERDSYILEKFARYCNFNGPILFRKKVTERHQNQKLLQIYSKSFYNGACKHGLHDNKTMTLKFPEIDHQYLNHFIRGYFDGDGCVFIKKYKDQTSTSIHFLGTYNMCLSIKTHLTKILNLRSNTKILPKKSIFKYTINDRKDLLKVIKFLYNGMNDCYLTRKLEKCNEVENYINNYYKVHPNRY